MARVLLVSGSARNRERLGGELLRRGLDVVAAASGEAGLSRLAEHAYDAAVIEARQPGLCGAALVREARIVSASTALAIVVLISGDGGQGDGSHRDHGSGGDGGLAGLLRVGADAVAGLPVSVDEVAELVEQVCRDAPEDRRRWLREPVGAAVY